MSSEARRRASRKYAENNREKLREMSTKRRESDPAKALWIAARNRAKLRGIPFTISTTDIIVPEYCPVLGFRLKISSGQPGGSAHSPSLDRKHPELGYVPGNVQVISRLANAMKSEATPEQLLAFSKWIHETYE